MYLVNIRYF